MPNKTLSIFSGLLEASMVVGGNAVINIKLISGSYDAQGSKFGVTYVVAYGDAVILIDV